MEHPCLVQISKTFATNELKRLDIGFEALLSASEARAGVLLTRNEGGGLGGSGGCPNDA